MNKKKITIIISALLVCALAFAIFWKATEKTRYIKGEMEDIQEQVVAFRAGERDSFHIYFLDYVAEDPGMEELLISFVKEMCENREEKMLLEFLEELEYTDYHSEALAAVLDDYLETYGDADFLFGILDSYTFKSLAYYNNKVTINRNTSAIASYIEEHGTQFITTTPGEGYYADKEEGTSKEVIGIEGSNLHDSVSLTNYGDFQHRHSYGVRLNRTFYEEENYSFSGYYFRGEQISFDPTNGECVWSGGYLFCFDTDGTLLGFDELVANNPERLDQQYDDAFALMESGYYEEAIAAFAELYGYRDSVDKIAACNDLIQEEIYNEAIALMDAGALREACTVFNYITSYKDSAEKAKAAYAQYMTNKQQTFEVGSYVSFGAIEQDNDLSNGIEDIEWLVLAKEDNRVLVISRYGLFPVSYNNKRTDVTWESCTLRQWLNSNFLNEAFLVQEQEQIPTVTVVAQAREGKDTQDKVFLLNVTEAEQYLSSYALSCQATEYAEANGTRVSDSNGNCEWWLRTPGKEEKDLAVYVTDMGGIMRIGGMVHIIEFAVRPAMWITIP